MRKVTKSLMLGLMCLGSTVVAADDPGKAIDWSGSGDYIQSNYAGVGTNAARTFETWARFDDRNKRPVVGEGRGSATPISISTLEQTPTPLVFRVGNDTTIRSTVDATANNQTWYHIAYTVEPNTSTSPTGKADIKLYINGLKIGELIDFSLDTGSATDGIRIGDDAHNAYNVWDGSFDETRYWSVALTESQIRAAASGLATTDGSNVKFGGVEEAGLNWSNLELYLQYEDNTNDSSSKGRTQTAPAGSSWNYIDFASFAFRVEVTGYNAITPPADGAGSVTNPTYKTEAELTAILPTTVTATEGAVIPVSWTTDFDTEGVATGPNSYECTAVLGDLPTGYVDLEPQATPTVTVTQTLTETDFVTDINDKIESAKFGKSQTLNWARIFRNVTDASGPEIANGVISIKGQSKTYYVQLTATAKAYNTNTNPTLRFRNAAAPNALLGVSSTDSVDSVFRTNEGIRFDVEITDDEAGNNVTAEDMPFGFLSIQLGNAGGNDFSTHYTDKDPAPAGVTITGSNANYGASANFSGAPTEYTEVASLGAADTNGFDINTITFSFGDDSLTPAIGVEVTQTGTLVEWTVEDERDVKEYQLIDADGNILETVVAKGLDSYSVTLDEFTVVELVVVDNDGSRQTFTPADGNEVTATYNLVEGWNLIATIGDYADLSEVEAATIGTMWAWDGNKYVATDAQDANQGIWVYAPVAKTVKAKAIKAGATLILQPGWTLAGPSNNVDAPADAVVFSWTTKYNEIIEKANALIQGQGYWFFVTEETEIDMDVE